MSSIVISQNDLVTLFNDSVQGPTDVSAYLRMIVEILCHDISPALDLTNIQSDLEDAVIAKLYTFGAIDLCKRSLDSIAESCAFRSQHHPNWGLLGGRLEALRLSLLVPTLKEYFSINEIWASNEGNFQGFALEHLNELESMIVPERDYLFHFCGMKTLQRSYLLNYNDKIIETPQRMYLRTAAYLWYPNLEKIKEYYDMLSLGVFTHASPTLFNSGVRKGNLASCFLLSIQDDLEKIYKCFLQCALISKATGGIGLDISNIRHSKIGFSGQSAGIMPMLQVLQATMKYVDQAGKRPGSATVYLQPWHKDFWDFLMAKRNEGSEERRARDLFYAVWNCDLFMKRVLDDGSWSMFCPVLAPMLKDTFGDEFEMWYNKYERMDLGQVTRPAREVWTELIISQIETGMPFMTNKDTANYTSNQQNIGLIRSSNLCVEITEVADEHQIASCNLASIALDEFVTNKQYDFDHLGKVTRAVVRAMNNVISRNWYPLEEIKSTNLKYRPLGIGVQALADTFAKMDLVWDSREAKELNRDIFATIYYHAMDESIEMAREHGSYDSFVGSPASHGLLKMDLMAMEHVRKNGGCIEDVLKSKVSPMYNWDYLREKVQKYGLYNSLLIALMPTASSAQIRYKNESFEPFTLNMYTKSVLSGNHIIVNHHMVSDLEAIGMWNENTRNEIMKADGSCQTLETADPQISGRLTYIKKKYLTAYELSQKLLVDMSIDRAYYVCQSQSLNIHIRQPTLKQLTGLHMYAWKECLTTGMYYLRTAPPVEAIKFTVGRKTEKKVVCTDDVCIMCQS